MVGQIWTAAERAHSSASAPLHVARRLPGVPLLANMTEFGRTPFFIGAEFEATGYKMVIWPVSSPRIANKAQAELYAAIKKDDGTQGMVEALSAWPRASGGPHIRNDSRRDAEFGAQHTIHPRASDPGQRNPGADRPLTAVAPARNQKPE